MEQCGSLKAKCTNMCSIFLSKNWHWCRITKIPVGSNHNQKVDFEMMQNLKVPVAEIPWKKKMVAHDNAV